MKTINIDNFGGGINGADLQLLIGDNQCGSGTTNAWAPQKALTKIPGYSTLYDSLTATGTALGSMYVDDSVNSSYVLYARVYIAGQGDNGYYPWAVSDALDALPLGYTTGSVSISGASLISATGNGTTWSTHVSADDLFRVNASAATWRTVKSVEDDTHLTLRSAVPVAVATGAAYTALPTMTYAETTWASLNGSWFNVSTADIMQQYNGSGMLRIPAAPKMAWLAVHKGYLFGLRTSTAESRLYWSAINAPTSWPATNFIDIDKARGRASGMISYGNELIIFKTRGMYKVVGEIFSPSDPTYSVMPISVPKDFMFNSHYAVAIHRGTLLFYAYRNVYAYQHGTFSIEKISNPISLNLPTAYSTLSDYNGSHEQRVHAISFNNYFILKGLQYLGGNPYGTAILDANGAWWFGRNTKDATSVSALGTSAMVVVPGTALLKPRLLIGSATYPHIYVWDLLGPGPGYDSNFNDPSTGGNVAIETTWVSKEFQIGYGLFKTLEIYLAKQSAGNLTVSWSVDQGTYVDNTVDMTTGRGQLIRKVLDINQKGSTLQLKVTQTAAGQTFQLYALKVHYENISEDRKL